MAPKLTVKRTIILMLGCISMAGKSSTEMRDSPESGALNTAAEQQCVNTIPTESFPPPSSNQTDDNEARYLYFTQPLMKHRGVINRLAIVATTATLSCPASGSDNLTYSWVWRAHRRGKFVENFNRIGNHPPIKQGDQLILESIVENDEGEYKCIVSSGPCSIEYTYRLIVTERSSKPVCDKRFPKNETTVAGSDATFECRVENTGPLQYTYWMKHHDDPGNAEMNLRKLQAARAVDSREKINSFIYHLFSDMVMESIYQGSLKMTLHDVTVSDSGMYTCFTINRYGSDYSSAWLAVKNDSAVESPVAETVTTTSPGITPTGPSHVRIGWVGTVLVIVFPVLSITVAVVTSVYVIRAFRRKRRKHRRMLAMQLPGKRSNFYRLASDDQPVHLGYDLPYGKWKPAVLSEFIKNTHTYIDADKTKKSIDDTWEFPRNRLALGEVLGEGAFGKVVKAEASGLLANQEKTTVAVKMLKAYSTSADMTALAAEMEYAKKVGKHINVISFLGCCTIGGPLLLLFEYAHHGNLRDFLRLRRRTDNYENMSTNGHKRLTHKDLISFAYQTARGMDFLASCKHVHRDLAARNVLVDNTLVMKIADFGLARDLHYENYYKKNSHGRVPIKWMSPEALFDRVYTTKSDVWSFGVVLWEIMTLGGTPYPSVAPEGMFEFLKSGKRMTCPQGCPSEIYDVMTSCWVTVPDKRPDFPKLVSELDTLVSASSNEEYLVLELPSMVCHLYESVEDSASGKKESTV